jgi:peptidoglycan biosynthesis protein MviN/MurJ (putative lipid II flippase)
MWFAIYLTGLTATLILGVYYSMAARRAGIHPLESRMTLGKMNISLGIMLLLLGVNQFTYEDLDAVRAGVAIVFLFVGGTNLVMGVRNYVRYRREWRETARQ